MQDTFDNYAAERLSDYRAMTFCAVAGPLSAGLRSIFFMINAHHYDKLERLIDSAYQPHCSVHLRSLQTARRRCFEYYKYLYADEEQYLAQAPSD